MDRKEVESRTKAFALRVLKLTEALPKTVSGRAVAGQLARSGSSVGANDRAAGRARSRREFIAKLGIVEEEADETAFWLEIVIENKMLPAQRVESLLDEADEILRIVVASIKSSRSRD